MQSGDMWYVAHGPFYPRNHGASSEWSSEWFHSLWFDGTVNGHKMKRKRNKQLDEAPPDSTTLSRNAVSHPSSVLSLKPGWEAVAGVPCAGSFHRPKSHAGLVVSLALCFPVLGVPAYTLACAVSFVRSAAVETYYFTG